MHSHTYKLRLASWKFRPFPSFCVCSSSPPRGEMSRSRSPTPESDCGSNRTRSVSEERERAGCRTAALSPGCAAQTCAPQQPHPTDRGPLRGSPAAASALRKPTKAHTRRARWATSLVRRSSAHTCMHTSVLTASFLLWASCVVDVLNI